MPLRITRRNRSTAGRIMFCRASSRISGCSCASTSTVAVTVGSIRARTACSVAIRSVRAEPVSGSSEPAFSRPMAASASCVGVG